MAAFTTSRSMVSRSNGAASFAATARSGSRSLMAAECSRYRGRALSPLPGSSPGPSASGWRNAPPSCPTSAPNVSGLLLRRQHSRQRLALQPGQEVFDNARPELAEHRIVHESQVRREHDVLALREIEAARQGLVVVNVK